MTPPCPYCKHKHPKQTGTSLGKKALREYFQCSACGGEYYNYYPLDAYAQYTMKGEIIETC